jgi:enterochelin esterase-like enzyme
VLSNPYLKRIVHRHELQSPFLHESRNVTVYLPPGYNELVSYPVLYTQDGEEFFNLGRIATQANQLILENEIDPLIIVGVFTDKSVRTEEYGPGYSKNENYLNFFTKDVVPFIEKEYPVRTHRDHRVLTGDSLGATVSMTLALKYRNDFINVISLSGAYFTKSLKELESFDDLSDLRVYQLIGTDETSVSTHLGDLDFLKANDVYYQALMDRGAEVKYVKKGGNHTWGFWQKELGDGLKHFFGSHH